MALAPTGDLETIWVGDLSLLMPNSIARAEDGAIYVGNRLLLLRLVPGDGGWRDEWLLPNMCLRPRVEGSRCVCG